MMDNVSFQNNIANLELAISYKFKDIKLIKQALTHPSIQLKNTKNASNNYERLEILGDSLLNFVITSFLFDKIKFGAEDIIAKIRAYLVCGDMLYNIANKIQLGNYIIMSSGEERSLGRFNKHNLENSMEALLGAVYLDSDLEIARKIIYNLWSEYINDANLDKIDLRLIDPKTFIQEWSVAQGFDNPVYNLVETTGPSHAPSFTVRLKIGPYEQIGHGTSIKLAKKSAARLLFNELKINQISNE